MPAQMTDPEIAAKHIATMDADQLIALRRHGVEEPTIAALASKRFMSVRKFQMLGAAEQGVTMSLVLVGLKPSEDVNDLVEAAGMLAAWQELKLYQTADGKVGTGSPRQPRTDARARTDGHDDTGQGSPVKMGGYGRQS